MGKAGGGNFLEDFRAGQEIRHATPRTLTDGDAALYLALTGSRFAQACSIPFALGNGLPTAPLDDLLVFHTVFGKTVPDLSLNAVANLGYADGFLRSLSHEDGQEGFAAYVGAHAAPILGRVSMDLITVDVTAVPEEICGRGAWVELIGPNVPAQTMAHHAGTIDYEVLTNLGRRAFRRYLGG